MKKLLFLIMIIGLGLSSCKKEDTFRSQQLEVLEIYGIKYPKDSILNEMSIGLGWPAEQIYFDSEIQKFKIVDVYAEFLPEDYLFLKNR